MNLLFEIERTFFFPRLRKRERKWRKKNGTYSRGTDLTLFVKNYRTFSLICFVFQYSILLPHLYNGFGSKDYCKDVLPWFQSPVNEGLRNTLFLNTKILTCEKSIDKTTNFGSHKELATKNLM